MLDLGREFVVTDIALYPLQECLSTFVGVTHGRASDAISELLFSYDLTTAKPPVRRTVKPVRCRFISLQFSQSDKNTEVPFGQTFVTPPNNVGYVQVCFSGLLLLLVSYVFLRSELRQ